MSHVASNYVKKMKVAPTGASIPATERALLSYIADGHNEEMGNFQFASVKLLAAYCDIGERQLRRVVRSVEEKGIVARIYSKRANGSHTINRYVFPALGYVCPSCNAEVGPSEKHGCVEAEKARREEEAAATKGVNTRKKGDDSTCAKVEKIGGKRTKNGAKAAEKHVDVTGGVGSSTTVPPCHPVQEGGVAHDSTLLSPTTALITNTLTNLSPDLSTNRAEADGDDGLLISEQESLKAKTARANSSPAPGQNRWADFKAELLRQIDKLPEKLREGALEVYDERIAATELEDASCEGDTLVPTWTILSANPEATQAGLDMLRENVKTALWKAAKGQVNVRVTGGYL